jgi:hypothetical protein
VGLRAVEAIGDSPIGKTMEELAPPPLREISLNGAHECVASGCAVYEIITTVDANAHVVECERLLLPFGDGEHVEQIVASLQLISFQGAIERQGFAREFVGKPQLTFTGMILSDAMTQKGPTAIAARLSQTNGTSTPAQTATDPREMVEPGSEQQPAADKRKAPRRAVLKTGRIRFGRSSEICTVRDMSATGAAIDAAGAAGVPDKFELVLEMESAARKCTVVWRKDRLLGVKFG